MVMWRARYEALKVVLRPLWVRILAPFALLYGTYDSTAHQFLPPHTAEKFPTIYGLVSRTSGWFPWWIWLLVIVAIFFLAVVDNVARSQHATRRSNATAEAEPLPDMLIHDLFFHIRADVLENAQEQRWEAVARDIMDRFSTGQLLAWGREIDKRSKRGGALTLIPRDYWRNRTFVYTFFQDHKGIGVLNNAEIAHTYSYQNPNDLQYADVRVNRAQAFGIWPQRFKEVNVRIRAKEPRRGDA
jgi:hypothetical protein